MNRENAPSRAATIAASLAVGAEATLLGLAGIAYAVLWAVGEGPNRSLSLGLAAVSAGAALGLAFLARALWQARRWAVSPALTWQVLQGFAGAYALSAGDVALGVVALGLALCGGVALAIATRPGPSSG